MKNLSVKSFSVLLAAVMLTAVFSIFLLLPTPIASADAPASQSGFITDFPTAGYVQSVSPYRLAANEKYLLVYDNALKCLFSMSEGTTRYDLSSSGDVSDVFVLGDAAVLVADGNLFSLNLTANDSVLQAITLPSPSSASYYFSDGEYLYAKSTEGYLSVYDDKLNAVFENVYSKYLLSEPVIAGSAETVYIFAYSYGNQYIKALDLRENEVESTYFAPSVLSACAANVIFAQNAGNLIAIDKNTFNVKFETRISSSDFCAYRDKLFAIVDGKINIYTLNNDNSSLSFTSSASMSGSDTQHLNNPSDLLVFDNDILIADNGNNRILYAATTPAVIEIEGVRHLAASDNAVYAASDNCVYTIRAMQVADSAACDEKILDIEYLDKLYVLTQSGIYTLFGGDFICVAQFSGGRKLSVAHEGNFLYVLSAEGILLFDTEGNPLETDINIDVTGVLDIKPDYQGNLFLLYRDKIIKITDILTACNVTDSYPLTSDNLRVTANALYLDDKTAYVCAEESLVGHVGVNAVVKEEYTDLPIGDLPSDEEICFLKLKDGESAFYFTGGGRVDNVTVFSPSTAVVGFNRVSAYSQLRYAIVNGETVLIPSDRFEVIQPAPLNAEYVLIKNAVLYPYPGCKTDTVVMPADAVLDAADDAAGCYDSKWIRVRCENKTYFIEKEALKPYSETLPEVKKVYGKAKADRVGGTVNIYSQPSSSSEIILSVVDGTELEILQTLEGFYMIKYNGNVGYVELDSIQLGGLTTVQIIAIALSALVLAAGAGIFIVIGKTKKKNENI